MLIGYLFIVKWLPQQQALLRQQQQHRQLPRPRLNQQRKQLQQKLLKPKPLPSLLLLPQPRLSPIELFQMNSIIMDAEKGTGIMMKEWDKITHADSFATVVLKKIPKENSLLCHYHVIQPMDNARTIPVQMALKVRMNFQFNSTKSWP